MKIERVSENQLKLTLTRSDLVERDIKLEDLISPSEKTQRLFRDIMEQALDEYDFIGENTPLMVEAVPVGMDGIMIIVTKVDSKSKGDSSHDFFSDSKDMRRWKKKSLELPEQKDALPGDLLIYSFDTLDDVIHLSLRLDDAYQGDSSLFKNNQRFFLVLQANINAEEENKENLELILEEYGQKHVSTPLAKYYLIEHGDTLIENRAVKALAKTFGD